MPTESIKPGKFFIKTDDGEIEEFRGAECVETTTENNDNLAEDIGNYEIKTIVSDEEKTVECSAPKCEIRRFQKMLGIQRITRKRFIKLLMSVRHTKKHRRKNCKNSTRSGWKIFTYDGAKSI